MAPPSVISLGEIITMTANVVYALPGVVVHLTSSAAVEVGMTTGTTGWNALTNAATIGANSSAPYIRSTLTDTLICVKRY